MIDYEKQMIIIDMKNEKHYSMCQMFSNCHENLKKIWLFRSHNYTMSQLSKQTNETNISTKSIIKQSNEKSNKNINDKKVSNYIENN